MVWQIGFLFKILETEFYFLSGPLLEWPWPAVHRDCSDYWANIFNNGLVQERHQGHSLKDSI